MGKAIRLNYLSFPYLKFRLLGHLNQVMLFELLIYNGMHFKPNLYFLGQVLLPPHPFLVVPHSGFTFMII